MGLIPVLLLALFAFWCGNFHGGASFSGAAGGQVLLLVAVVTYGLIGPESPSWRDPFRLGTAGRWLPAALLVSVLGSLMASPVPRAGRVGVVLLPAFFFLPAAVAACWSRPEARTWGGRGIAITLNAVAVWAVFSKGLWLSPRAAMPLGHHNLLAAFLAISVPLGAWVWSHDPLPRWRKVASWGVVTAAVATLASGSLGGTLGLVAGLLCAYSLGAFRWPRLRGIWAAGAVIVAVVFSIRIFAIVTGRDPSSAARLGYWQAGWRGWSEAPLLGWGPGSTAWSMGSFYHPVPGAHPSGQVVGQLHAQPLELAYELGGIGLLLSTAVLGLFWVRRLRERDGAAPELRAAGLGGLVAGGVTALTNSWLTVTALPVALAVAAGAALAGGTGGGRSGEEGRPRAESQSPGTGRPGRIARLAWVAYGLAAAALLVGPGRGLFHYEIARQRSGEDLRAHLERAVRSDPTFPLYRALLARETRDPDLALGAAREAPGVAALWISAGELGAESARPWAAEALERALALDPLGSLAPQYLVELAPSAPRAVDCGARALLSDPALGAAVFWERHPRLLTLSADRLRRWEGIDPGWRETVAGAVEGLVASDFTLPLSWAPELSGDDPAPEVSSTLALALRPGAEAGGLALHAFRRRSWDVSWAEVEVRVGSLLQLSFPRAGSLPESSASAFPGISCAPNAQTP